MTSTERDDFLKRIDVSQEALIKLDRYAELLVEWNQKFNLVASSTIPHIWQRHFLDSAQLLRYIPEEAHLIADLGAGAGFPGLILAILGKQKVYLVESVGKKAKFLQTVIDELQLNAVVRHERAEDIKDLTVDVVTSRACASVNDLLNYSRNLVTRETIYIFPKGQNVDVELTESAKYWTYRHNKRPSLTDNSGSVLILQEVKTKYVGTFKKQ